VPDLGLVEAAGEVFPQAAWQRCVVHWYRNALSNVPRAKMREVALMLKAIHAQESRRAAESKAAAVVAELGRMKTSVVDTLSYLAFPSERWRRIQSPRAHHARDKAPDAFPDGQPRCRQKLAIEGGTSCRGINRLALVHQGDGFGNPRGQ
jgi:hypothetical protein